MQSWSPSASRPVLAFERKDSLRFTGNVLLARWRTFHCPHARRVNVSARPTRRKTPYQFFHNPLDVTKWGCTETVFAKNSRRPVIGAYGNNRH